LFDEIRALGMRVGLSFEPETPFETVAPYLADIDLLLVMSVHTGFGGQPFIAEVLDKVRAARAAIDERALPVEIEIDGGIKVDNAHLAVDAGVDILVSGTGIFGADDPAAAARAIKASGARR
jgi:ribulose-phosphate 3-epimerase